MQYKRLLVQLIPIAFTSQLVKVLTTLHFTRRDTFDKFGKVIIGNASSAQPCLGAARRGAASHFLGFSPSEVCLFQFFRLLVKYPQGQAVYKTELRQLLNRTHTPHVTHIHPSPFVSSPLPYSLMHTLFLFFVFHRCSGSTRNFCLG